MINIKSTSEIAKMRAAGKIVSGTFKELEKHIKPGITTKELDKIAFDYIKSQGAEPSFLGYCGYPASICASVNDTVIHGIPDATVLKEGDIISIDIGAVKDGYHGDAARTYPVGKISDEAKRLIEVTKQSFFEGLKYAKNGERLFSISATIQDYVESHGYNVIRNYCGHGIGKEMHESPEIPNHGVFGRGVRLAKGMTIAVEPMVNAGGFETKCLSDGWTVKSKDGSLACHYENTILITDGEPELLTCQIE
ncbi:MAG: type I methionyl aminopeptidase [Clostridia bacterium]|nr:type I methionyl aminopeptidase [Clostridia bacterium]